MGALGWGCEFTHFKLLSAIFFDYRNYKNRQVSKAVSSM